ncbi:MBL fold metallo-hydrolase [Pelagibius sp. Alg239-R121]|uniref:MBL fold metallo-hydrolase n=1 Tax=Pelagibius sp. Alg239-R121 TaxID=2993448 RepID=UPI0024A72BC9|nr:MBL fold metallo-hydrolase [Pelagibius sp. Alg239-R121]
MARLTTAGRLTTLTAVAILTAAAPSLAQDRDFSKVEIKTEKVTDSIYALFGAGGNIGVSVGSDGVFIIDDQYAPLSDKILAAVRELSDKPIRFVINTHWHGDHTGGNENIGREGAAIVAHENVRKRLLSPQTIPAFNRTFEAAPAGALPQVTYVDGVTLHLNGEHARIAHLPNAHTDGDSFIHFTEANVVHTGDLFFNGFYPFIDAWSGGSIDGVIAAVDVILGIANDKTKIIPGHGPLATRTDLVAYRDMLQRVNDLVTQGIADGKSAEELVKSGAFTDIETTWADGFLNTEKFISIVYEGKRS